MQATVNTVEAAWQLLGAGRFTEASQAAHAVMAREPENVGALCCAAMADWELGGAVADSIALLERAIRLEPKNPAIVHNLATLHASNGDAEAAGAGFEQALSINPTDTRAFFSLAQNRRFSTETALVRQMLGLYSAGTLARGDLEFLCFGLAKVYSDLGNPDRAMHFCIEANRLAGRGFDMKAERVRLQAIRELVEDGELKRGKSAQPGAAPVFIVGMPRSGTTLVEAMLSRHPAVHALGESKRIGLLDKALTGFDPRNLLRLDRDKARAAAEAAMRQMREKAGPATRAITDKTPDNAFRIGLIARLFPNARIIHIRRHPLDCGLSNLFTRFTAGQGFAFRQTELGERIRQTAEVMTLWRRADLLPILDVSYEQLVASPEFQGRRMTDFLELDWDPACLSPEQAARQVQTASQYQVRQKINNGSVGRHADYAEWLAPLIEAVGGQEWIAAEVADQQRAVASS